MYPYSILESTRRNCIPHSENIDAGSIKKIEEAVPVKINEDLLASICSLVQTVASKAIRLKQEKHSSIVISTPKTKRAFISLHKKLDTQGAQGISHKLALMLEFDASAHFIQAKEVVILKSAWKEDESISFSSLERRVAIMQELEKSAYFPENYGFVFTKGKTGKMLRIYQEKANCDLFDYHDTHYPLHELTDAEKHMIAKNLIFALCDMQEANVVHRDIKLENILAHFSTRALENIKLTDLGLACSLEDKDRLQIASGSMGWVPPEIFEQEGTSLEQHVYLSRSFSKSLPP